VRLEGCIEEHILGVGLNAAQRGLALAGLLASVAGYEAPERGLHQLLERKRDGNAALRMFLRVRSRGVPILGSEPAAGGGVSLLAAAGAIAATGEETVAGNVVPQVSLQEAERTISIAVEALARVNPVLEDHHYSREVHLNHLKRLDLVRDRALWITLVQLTDPKSGLTTETIGPQMMELDELLRRKGLEDLAPLLRRCLLSTWLLPDMVSSLLDVWSEDSLDVEPAGMCMVVQRAMAELPKYFPGPFVPHVARISEHLRDDSIDSVHSALKALARLGKRYAMTTGGNSAGHELAAVSPAQLAELLLEAVGRLCGAGSSGGDAASICRKALRTLGVLPSETAWECMEKVLDWTSENANIWIGEARSIALRLVSACIDWSSECPGCPAVLREKALAREWISRARAVLNEVSSCPDSSLQEAAVEFLAAAGASVELTTVFDSSTIVDSVRLHASVCALRAFRRGSLPLSTGLLQRIAVEACAACAPDRSGEVGELLGSLLKIVKATGSSQDVVPLKLSDRLRLCATLPTVFAQSQTKRHKADALRILQSAFAKAVRQSGAQQKPLLDFAVACFIHFLARLPEFVKEASQKFSAYPESSQISSLFVEALMHVEQPKSTELSSIVLRVTERVHLFVDREDPTSDMVHKAAQVLKYTMEKRCPGLGRIDKTLQGVCRGSMPAELFALGHVTHGAPAGPLSQLESGGNPEPIATPALTAMSHEATTRPTEVISSPATASTGQQPQPPVRDSLMAPNTGTDARSSAASEVAAAQPSPAMPSEVDSSPVVTPMGDTELAPRRLSFPSTAGRREPTLLRSRPRSVQIHHEAARSSDDSHLEGSSAKRQRTEPPLEPETENFE